MTRFIPASLLHLAIAITIPSLTSTARADNTGGRGHFAIGYMNLDTTDLNNTLAAQGYSKIPGDFLTAGGGGYALFDNGLILGGTGLGLVSSEKQIIRNGERYEQMVGAGLGLFKIGYAVVRTADMHIAPQFGIGGGGIAIDISKKEDLSFNQALDNPNRTVNLSKGGLALDFGITFNHLIGAVVDDEDRGGFAVGAEVGYVWSPGAESKWFDGSTEVSGGPDFSLQGFYLRLTIGGGADSVKKPREHSTTEAT